MVCCLEKDLKKTWTIDHYYHLSWKVWQTECSYWWKRRIVFGLVIQIKCQLEVQPELAPATLKVLSLKLDILEPTCGRFGSNYCIRLVCFPKCVHDYNVSKISQHGLLFPDVRRSWFCARIISMAGFSNSVGVVPASDSLVFFSQQMAVQTLFQAGLMAVGWWIVSMGNAIKDTESQLRKTFALSL